MQVLIQKTTEVAKIQQIQHQETNLKQHEMAHQIAAQTQQNTKTVNKPLANEAKLVHEKQEHENNEKKRRKKRGDIEKEENTEEEHTKLDVNRGNNLDILA